jgi:dCTP deaminase
MLSVAATLLSSMAVLSDRDIRSRLNYRGKVSDRITDRTIGIEPCEDHQVQPASIDLTLADEWCTYDDGGTGGLSLTDYPIDIDYAKEVQTEKIIADQYMLRPHKLILCSTIEYVDIPYDIQGQVHGKSSLGRLGLLVHITAGFIDPGFKGKITLEMYNLNNRPIILRAGKPICQLSMTKLSSAAEKPYGHPDLRSHYQDQKEVTGSLYDG